MKKYAVLHKTEISYTDKKQRWAVSRYDGAMLALIKKDGNRYYATLFGTRTASVCVFDHLRPILQEAIDHEYK